MHTPQSHRLRTGRYAEQGRIYLITLVVENRQPLFADWITGRPIIQALKAAHTEGEVDSLSWVLMPDHLHWLFELKTETLGRVVCRLKSRSTVVFNRHQGRHGRLWQAGFHDRALRQEEDLKAVARYIVANPLRAGLAENIGDYCLWDAAWL